MLILNHHLYFWDYIQQIRRLKSVNVLKYYGVYMGLDLLWYNFGVNQVMWSIGIQRVIGVINHP